MVCIYNGLILSHKKEQSWVIYRDVDGPRVHPQRSKSGGEKQILYINACMPPDKSVCRSKQQLELDMEQETGSKSGKEYIKVVYCYPAYFTSMQSTS